MPVTTATLLGVMETRKKFVPVLRTLFFPKRKYFNSEKIDLDKVTRKNKKAPFVSPLVQGVVRRIKGHSTLSVYPAYVKPKNTLEPSDLQTRLPGEDYNTPLSPAQRRDAIMMQMAIDQSGEIDVTEEYMCAQIVKYGKIIIKSEQYPANEIDFGRNPDNTIILAPGTKWTEVDKADYDMYAKLTDYMGRAKNPVTMMLMNQNTYAVWSGFASVKEKLETRRGSESRLETAAFNGELFVMMGKYGSVEVWVYTGTYDEGDEELMFFEDGDVLFSSSGAQGTMAYGMIHDKKANYAALERFPKEFEEDDPAGEYMMTQSAPLSVPEDPNSFVFLKAY